MNEHVTPKAEPAPQAAPEPAPESLLPLEIAMNAEHADPAPDSPARRVLLAQERLLGEQVALARNERFRNRIKAARDLSLVAVVALLLVGVVALVLNARSARGLVLESFSVPPPMAARGLTGEVVARRVLDHIEAMEAANRAAAVSGVPVRAGGGGVRVQIPETGISLDELVRFLRRRLGKETAVTGEVFRDGDRLVVAVRPEGLQAVVVSGSEAETAKLIERAAEGVYERTQPLRYATYLLEADRVDEATRVIRADIEAAGADQAAALTLWGVALSRIGTTESAAMQAWRDALSIDPDYGYAHGNLAVAYSALGQPGRAERHARRAVAVTRTRDRGGFDPGFVPLSNNELGAMVAGLYQDGQEADRLLQANSTIDPTPSFTNWAHNAVAQHEPTRALALLRRYAETSERRIVAAERVRARVEGELGRWEDAASRLAAVHADPRLREAAARSQWLPRETALTYAKAGRHAEAEAFARRLPVEYDSARTRGAVAALAGRQAEADQWFARAVALAPGFPQAHQDRAEARLARGDLAGALRAAREAQERGPRWADPLKLQADVLARQGKHRAAVRLYDEAAERAPRWGALRLAWGRSLEASGRRDEARAKYAQAARLDLSPADRAAVQRLLARTPAPAR